MTKESMEIVLQFKSIAACARTGDLGTLSSQLNICVQKLSDLLAGGWFSKTETAKVVYSLETLLMMQEQKDWVAFADIIEYELLEFFQ